MVILVLIFILKMGDLQPFKTDFKLAIVVVLFINICEKTSVTLFLSVHNYIHSDNKKYTLGISLKSIIKSVPKRAPRKTSFPEKHSSKSCYNELDYD